MPVPPPDTPFQTTTDREEARALLRLVLAGGPHAPRRALLDHAGSARAALGGGVATWRAAGLDAAAIAQLRTDAAPAPAVLDWLDAPTHALIGWTDPLYPPALREAANPPVALFVAGDATLLWRPAVAVVGTRQPTAGGRDNAAMFARTLAGAGFVVASGMAAGIDTAVHEAALASGAPTVAVLGTGPDVAYPASNARLRVAIAGHGALVSEHPPGTGPRKEHFPSRNRLLAALALGTVVVEAALRSGALITARLAAEAGREVFAVPGSIHNPMARGCHRLLRDGATLVESPAEVIDALTPGVQRLAADLRLQLQAGAPISPPQASRTPATDPTQAAVPTPLPTDPDSHILWLALGHDPTDMDQLVQRTGLTPSRVSSMLLVMELEGRVAARHGRYHRVH